MKSYSHPLGLTLQAPATYSVRQTDRGFIFKSADSATVRSPTQIVVELRDGAVAPGVWPERRRVKGRTVSYRIDVDTGAGSGGDYHALRAWEQSAQRHVWLEQEIQVEAPLEPDFSTAWNIIESIEVKSN